MRQGWDSREAGVVEVRAADQPGDRLVLDLFWRAQAKPGRDYTVFTHLLGQAHNLYILGQTREGLVIIDQHAAHERINYERLRDEYAGGKVKSQTLLSPRTLELAAREKRALEAGSGTVQRLGYDVEDFGGRSCVVKAVPVVGGQALSPESLKDVMDEMLEAAGKPGFISEAGQDRLLKLMACHSSVRAGERMEMEQMRALVEALYRAQNPFSCPHGRPTIIHMTKDELEKKFGRTG
jgi:DNA mismatch repair protein MutL